MFKFVHVADIHLDSPLRGLERYEGAPIEQIRHATRRALAGLVQTAIDERVAFVLIAGDLYDGDWRDYNTGLYFVAQAARLREAGIPLYLIAGNHDAANKMTKSLRLPDNVTFFSEKVPETVTLEEHGVAIHGQSFAREAVYEDLSLAYPKARGGLFNIGLLHTSATGREGHDNYAPCRIDGLAAKGYDYWALGHVHTRETLCTDPLIVFPGNLQGRHIRETGPKGCLLVSVEDQRAVETEFLPLDVLRWERAEIDASRAQGIDDVLKDVAARLKELHHATAGRPLAIRVELTGRTPLHERLMGDRHHWTNEIRSQAIGASDGEIWVEKVKIQTASPPRTSPGAEPGMADGPLGELLSLIEDMRTNPGDLKQLGVDFADLARKLPGECKELARFDDPDWLRSIVEEAEAQLLNQLTGEPLTDEPLTGEDGRP